MAVSAGNIVSLATKPIQYGRILHFGIDKVRGIYITATAKWLGMTTGHVHTHVPPAEKAMYGKHASLSVISKSCL